MKAQKYYYHDESNYLAALRAAGVAESTEKCSCGETRGGRIKDDSGQTTEVLLLCTHCYQDAPLRDRMD